MRIGTSHTELLEQWDIDVDALHALSLKNLDRYFESHSDGTGGCRDR